VQRREVASHSEESKLILGYDDLCPGVVGRRTVDWKHGPVMSEEMGYPSRGDN
jgi:hypothetical protein